MFSQKYSWHFHHSGADGKFGDTNLSLITEDNPIGLNLYDPRSKDDIVSPELVLPCGRQVELITGSADVIHALGDFHDKMEIDAFPSIEERKLFKLRLSLLPELYTAFNYAAPASRIIMPRIATLMMRHLRRG